ncbi:hypothetical protein FQA39_LY01821 [Lamprigera yunnana]|nr:hypothetical protein FQA39_LY01821 [Lamprigera yunnana]
MSSIKVEPNASNETEESAKEFTRKSIKKKEPKLKPPSALERVFGKVGKPRDHYFTAGVNINESNQRNVHTEPLPFSYPKDLEQFSYRLMAKAWRDKRIRQENQLKCKNRQSNRTSQKVDLLNRLYVKDPEIKSMKTILDIDPEFFTLIEGRPVVQKFNRLGYVRDMRDILRTNVITGYREDEILLIEENFSEEMRILEEIKAEFQKYVNTFEEFLFNDHTSAMSVLLESEKQAKLAAEKADELRSLSKNYGSLRSIVYNLEEKWRNCKMYQKFLYLISPSEWRREHDFYFIAETSSTNLISHLREDSSIFERFRLSPNRVQSLDELIEQFLEDVSIQSEPALFFTEPDQLLKVFSFIELQNLNTLLHSEELAVPIQNVKEALDAAEENFAAEISALHEMIDKLEEGIKWEEQRAKYLEELAVELINGDFREIISNKEVINLYVFVEDVYESRIGVNDSNMSMKEMMRIVETSYRNYLLQLDRLPDDVVYKAEMTCYREEEKILMLAHDATRKLTQVEQLMKHLTRLLEPPVYKISKPLRPRSPPVDIRKKRTHKARHLTQEQLDFLNFFSDFCFHSDDPNDFGVDFPQLTDDESNKDAKL